MILVKGSNPQTCVLDCQHRFCHDCVKEHFGSLIRSRQLEKIVCPDDTCKRKVSIKEILRVIKEDKALLDKYVDFSVNQVDLLTRFCVKPGCEGQVRAKDINATKLKCPICSTAVCFKCRDAWHGH